MSKMLVMSSDEVEELFKKAIDELIGKMMEKQSANQWMPIPKLMKRYGLSRARLKDMIESGKLPAEARNIQGGNGWVVRACDAERVLGVKPRIVMA